ncbi:MAG: hypothetical protein IKO63_01275 [Paludibacteraceae bacterium]|nr:hypothetical protein [Paludibacteraceae bacterium]
MPDPSSISSEDSVKQTGFVYNTCDSIRFLPGAAMGQQQHLTYNTAVVDMSLPHNQWAFRSAPVTGMLSGDIFMANADLTSQTSTWEAGEFDASGRNATTGNASFWLSLYSRSIVQKGNGNDIKDSTRTAAAQWSRVTNGMDYYLPPALGWAIYTRTANGRDADVRLPKKDDIYYYYDAYGEKMNDFNVPDLRAERDVLAGGTGKAGKLAFDTDGTYKEYTLENDSASTAFVFGNPTMGYIDIWGFIADNSLDGSIAYMASNNEYTTISRAAAEETSDVITNPQRYLPPMHAMVISTTSGTSKTVRINTNRIVTSPSQVVRPTPAPHRIGATGLSKGIMTVTAVNPVSSRCTSRLLIGQGYHSAILDGEDALLTTVNINNYTNTSAPATPFNIYAVEGEHGLSINLRDEVLNVPVSFYMSDLPYDPVTHLWFTGVNNIEGQLVLYDALTNSERLILDGIRLDIPTPEASHETRYYIRRRGFDPSNPDLPITTAIQEPYEQDAEASAIKIIKDGHVLILRDGHIYTMFGQKLR